MKHLVCIEIIPLGFCFDGIVRCVGGVQSSASAFQDDKRRFSGCLFHEYDAPKPYECPRAAFLEVDFNSAVAAVVQTIGNFDLGVAIAIQGAGHIFKPPYLL